jgi:L-ascorbate metabolism protein UlaG (beta-lactamase superfamily)
LEEKRHFTRRSFLTGCVLAGASAWLLDSDQMSARVIRGMVSDAPPQSSPQKPNPSLWRSDRITAAWLGHASVLVNFFGTTILTDPTLCDRIGADLGFTVLGRKRLVSPALSIHELPPIDLVLLSHAHMDHLDCETLAALPKRSQVITAAKTSDLISGFPQVQELRWGDSACLRGATGDLTVEAFEVKHWGARWKRDTYRGYNGYLLSKNGRKIIFGGDTALCDQFKPLRSSRQIDLAIMPIGSYGRGNGSHCTPEESVRMVNDCGAEYILPIHHSTFPLGKEPLTEPLERLEKAIAPERIALREIGESFVAA